MAREEADRENLLGEATAYLERIEWKISGSGLPCDVVFAGFRRNGAPSFYFGADPVYHFNAAGELRRAFAQGQLIKAESGQLVAMQRVRSGEEVSLKSSELSAEQTAAFRLQTATYLGMLLAALQNRRAIITGQVPQTASIEQRVVDWLASHPEIVIANSAGADG